jgi:hypothetical protein
MKKQTAMMEHIQWLYEVIDISHAQNVNQEIIQAIEYVIEGAKAKLPMEKEQIIKAVLDGYRSHPYMAEQYFNETYGGDK